MFSNLGSSNWLLVRGRRTVCLLCSAVEIRLPVDDIGAMLGFIFVFLILLFDAMEKK